MQLSSAQAWDILPEETKQRIRQLYQQNRWKSIKSILKQYEIMNLKNCGTCQADQKLRVMAWVKYAINHGYV